MSASPMSSSMSAAFAPARLVRLERMIHDDVLQALGCCVLGAELCKRFWRKGQAEQVVRELDEVLRGLETAVESTRRMAAELDAVGAWLGRAARRCAAGNDVDEAGRRRPRLTAVGASIETAGPKLASANTILQTLGVCLLQAELSRRMYLANQEQPALRELNTMLERLDGVTTTFRGVMQALRRADQVARCALTRSGRGDLVPTEIPDGALARLGSLLLARRLGQVSAGRRRSTGCGVRRRRLRRRSRTRAR